MISWMQKHNKYLVWTIWVATIAFIGAGFVGWGSYDMGGKAGSVAKVGNVEISQSKLNMAYSNIYDQYNRAMGGKLDEKKAKEMGLIKQAFSRVSTQAKILNFAQDSGIIVSDKEIAQKIQAIPSFQKDGQFNKEIYTAYLSSQRMNAKVFESTLRDELVIQKTFSLLTVDTLPLETEAISSAMNVSDKLAYKVLSTDDVTVSVDDSNVKPFWEIQKEQYMTQKMFDLSVVWTKSKDIQVSDDEIKNYYEENSFNFTNAEGKQLNLEEAKEEATKGLKLKKTKKSAQKAYIAFKKGTLAENEKIVLPLGDKKFTNELWEALKTKSIGDIIKPKIIGDMYATVKIENIVEPRVKSYDEAKSQVSAVYTTQAKHKALIALSEETLNTFDNATAIMTDFVKLEENVKLKALNNQESLQFLQKLFTSSKEKGIISVSDKVVVYNVLEQKLSTVDENQTETVKQTVNTMKQNTFESNLIKLLDKKYPTETYVGGLSN
jgi:peptidyl-prolyl cis-trans isomerase D